MTPYFLNNAIYIKKAIYKIQKNISPNTKLSMLKFAKYKKEVYYE